MLRRKKYIVIILLAIIVFYVFSFALNSWLSLTMQRHQLIQLPVMILIGMSLGYMYPKVAIRDLSWAISAFIIVMSSLTFWMIPRSVDYTIMHVGINRLMHLNMILVGIGLVAIFRKVMYEVKIYFLGMISAMLMVSGVTLRIFAIQLCTSFNIDMQKETGFYMIILSVCFFLYTVITVFRIPLKEQESTN